TPPLNRVRHTRPKYAICSRVFAAGGLPESGDVGVHVGDADLLDRARGRELKCNTRAAGERLHEEIRLKAIRLQGGRDIWDEASLPGWGGQRAMHGSTPLELLPPDPRLTLRHILAGHGATVPLREPTDHAKRCALGDVRLHGATAMSLRRGRVLGLLRHPSAKKNEPFIGRSRPEGSTKGSIPASRSTTCKSSRNKNPVSGAFAEPSDGLEPSTPSLPCDPNGNWWQPTATVCRYIKPFLGLWRAERLPSVAPPLFHHCSIPNGRKRARAFAHEPALQARDDRGSVRRPWHVSATASPARLPPLGRKLRAARLLR